MNGPRYRALLIGNATFPEDPHNLPTLEGPRNDPAALKWALSHPDVGLFGPGDVRLVPEQTARDVLIELEDFFSSASRDDVLLLYYSGHGKLNENGQLFLCARDTRTDRLRATAISERQIHDLIDSSAAQATVIVLDCCHAGAAFKGGGLPQTLHGTGRYILASSRRGQLSNDTDQRNHTSLFTQHLVDGILSEAPDSDGDGFVDLDELYHYVHTRLLESGRQIPQRDFSGGGDVAIARRAPVPVPPPPPPVEPEPAPPLLDLSASMIDLGTVELGHELPPERVEVRNLGGGDLDWTAETDASWLRVDAGGDAVVVTAAPETVGVNRGAVRVHDRASGAARTVRFVVRVTEPRPDEPQPDQPLEPVVGEPVPVVRPVPHRTLVTVGALAVASSGLLAVAIMLLADDFYVRDLVIPVAAAGSGVAIARPAGSASRSLWVGLFAGFAGSLVLFAFRLLLEGYSAAGVWIIQVAALAAAAGVAIAAGALSHAGELSLSGSRRAVRRSVVALSVAAVAAVAARAALVSMTLFGLEPWFDASTSLLVSLVGGSIMLAACLTSPVRLGATVLVSFAAVSSFDSVFAFLEGGLPPAQAVIDLGALAALTVLALTAARRGDEPAGPDAGPAPAPTAMS